MAQAHHGSDYQRDRATLRSQGRKTCQHHACKYPGIPIDYQAGKGTPLSFSAGHKPGMSVHEHGRHLGLTSLQPEHYACNVAEGARVTHALRRTRGLRSLAAQPLRSGVWPTIP